VTTKRSTGAHLSAGILQQSRIWVIAIPLVASLLTAGFYYHALFASNPGEPNGISPANKQEVEPAHSANGTLQQPSFKSIPKLELAPEQSQTKASAPTTGNASSSASDTDQQSKSKSNHAGSSAQQTFQFQLDSLVKWLHHTSMSSTDSSARQ